MKTTKNFKFIFLPCILFIIQCKVYNKVSYNYDKSIDFTKYKTFAWLPDTDTSKSDYDNAIIRNNTRNYFSHSMADRGYKADTKNPDVLLELIITEKKKEEIVSNSNNTQMYPNYYPNNNPYYYPYPNNYYYQTPYNNNYSNTVTQEQEYTEGGITLNVIDRKLNKLVWRGTASGDLYDPATIEENLSPAVYDILKKYPIPPLKKQKKPKRKHQINEKIK